MPHVLQSLHDCLCMGSPAAAPCQSFPRGHKALVPTQPSVPPILAAWLLMPPPDSISEARKSSKGPGHREALLPRLTPPLACHSMPGSSRCLAWDMSTRNCHCPQARAVPAHPLVACCPLCPPPSGPAPGLSLSSLSAGSKGRPSTGWESLTHLDRTPGPCGVMPGSRPGPLQGQAGPVLSAGAPGSDHLPKAQSAY